MHLINVLDYDKVWGDQANYQEVGDDSITSWIFIHDLDMWETQITNYAAITNKNVCEKRISCR